VIPPRTPGGPIGRWVHVFEEDSERGDVYRRAESRIPLSRRPREQLELNEDGSATFSAGGPDDRLVGRLAFWIDEGGEIVIRFTGELPNSKPLRVIEQSAERLVVRR
jgi:hypothetical protein